MAQSAKNGHIELKLVVDNSSFKSGLEGAKKALGGLSSESLRAENGLQKATQGLRGLSNSGAVAGIDRLKTAFIGLQSVIAVVAAAGIGILTKNLIDAASEAQETANKFNVTFSGIRKEADLTADNLAKNFGLANDEAQALLSNTGDLLTGFGFTQESALALSDATNKLAVDLASFTNYSGGAKGASEALTKALLGERESIKSLGIAILEEDVKAKIKSLEVTGELTNETEREKRAIATLAIAYEQAKNSVGDFARSQFEYANQIRVTDSIVRNLTVGLGKGLLPAVTEMRKAFNLLAKENGEKLINAFKQIIEFSGGIAKAIGGIVQVFKPLVPIVLEFAGTAFSLIKYIGIGLDAVLSTLADFVRVLSAAGVAMSKFIKGDFNFADNFKAELDKTESYLKQFVDRVNNGYNPQVSAEINTPGKSNANKTPAGGEGLSDKERSKIISDKIALLKAQHDLEIAQNDFTAIEILERKKQLEENILAIYKQYGQQRTAEGISQNAQFYEAEKARKSKELKDDIELLDKKLKIELKAIEDAKAQEFLFTDMTELQKAQRVEYYEKLKADIVKKYETEKVNTYELSTQSYINQLDEMNKATEDSAKEIADAQLKTQEAMRDTAERFAGGISSTLRQLADGTLTIGDLLKRKMLDIAEAQLKTGTTNLFKATSIAGTSSGLSSSTKWNVPNLLSKGMKLFGYSTGGIIPGSFSQPVPIMAHGSEMVLNPKQQNTLFDLLNNGYNGGQSQAPSYVYAPQITTGASAQDVFGALEKHKDIFFGMIKSEKNRNPRIF